MMKSMLKASLNEISHHQSKKFIMNPNVATDTLVDTSIREIVTYSAQIPDPLILGGFVSLTILLFGTTLYWWNIVIPQQRTSLANSKYRGEIKTYLDDLENSVESSFYVRLQSWFFTDWLEKRRKRSQSKPSALPFLKKAKWNSGDNPILVAFAGIMACVLASSILERSFNN